MDETVEPTAAMLDGSDVMSRLATASQRLRELARAEAPQGLTEPDPGGTERWEAGQVWSHIAEFVPYWHSQIESVIGEYAGEPVPFGRTKADPDRLAGIEMGKTTPIADEAAQSAAALEDVKRYVQTLTPVELSAVGLHPVRGEMSVENMVETFLVNHLEEHVEQLDGLRS